MCTAGTMQEMQGSETLSIGDSDKFCHWTTPIANGIMNLCAAAIYNRIRSQLTASSIERQFIAFGCIFQHGRF